MPKQVVTTRQSQQKDLQIANITVPEDLRDRTGVGEHIRPVSGRSADRLVEEPELLIRGAEAHRERRQGQGGGDLGVSGVRESARLLVPDGLVELHG